MIVRLNLKARRGEVEPDGQRMMEVEDLDVAQLEPGRETLRSRRRRAAFADVMDELDDMVSDFDDE